MLASEHIDIEIRPISLQTTVGEALENMQDVFLAYLPLTEEDKLLGIISEDQLLDLNPDETIASLLPLPTPVFIYEKRSELEAIQILHHAKTEILPVLNKDDNYMGCISMRSLFNGLAKTLSSAQGGIIVLRVPIRDYQLSQIVQIVESGDALISTIHTILDKDQSQLLVTLHTNRFDLDGIVQTFRRYQYEVIMTFYDSKYRNSLMDRYHSLIRYLNP